MNNQPRHYQLRPTTVTAMQFTGTVASTEAIFQWLGEHGVKCYASRIKDKPAIVVPGPKGNQIAIPGFYIAGNASRGFFAYDEKNFKRSFELTQWEQNRDGDMWPEQTTNTQNEPELAACRFCGCTENAACNGGCAWANEEQIRTAGLEPMDGDVCSRCIAPPITPERPNLKALYGRLPHDTRIHKVIADGETYHWVDIYVGDRSVVCEVKTDPAEAMQAALDKWDELHKQKNEQ